MSFKKITAYSLLLAGIAMSPHALADQSFDGHTVNVAFEEWDSLDADVGNPDVIFEVTNKKDILASDGVYPDEKDFYTGSQYVEHFNWDIDFNQNVIELTYTSIEANESHYEYRHDTPKGFHFEDRDNCLHDIINVTVGADFAPAGFNPDLVTFDADNIYVNLKGSECLYELPAVSNLHELPQECTNPDSPTGYDNLIKLRVEFASYGAHDQAFCDKAIIDEPTIDQPTNDKVIIDQATIDKLYDWAESKYPQFLPADQGSMHVVSQYIRYYPKTGFHMGSIGGRFYSFSDNVGGLLDLGKLDTWLEEMEIYDFEAVDKAALDRLYDWAESKYPEFFPTHQRSYKLSWGNSRFYPDPGVYIGSMGARIFVYGAQFGGLLELGKVSHWVEEMEADYMDNK